MSFDICTSAAFAQPIIYVLHMLIYCAETVQHIGFDPYRSAEHCTAVLNVRRRFPPTSRLKAPRSGLEGRFNRCGRGPSFETRRSASLLRRRRVNAMLRTAPQAEVRPGAIFNRGTKRGRKSLIPLGGAGKITATPWRGRFIRLDVSSGIRLRVNRHREEAEGRRGDPESQPPVRWFWIATPLRGSR